MEIMEKLLRENEVLAIRLKSFAKAGIEVFSFCTT